jgi:hydrogenase large subunit
MASVRSLDNALETDTALAVTGLSQQKITNDDGRTQIPDSGRIIRNLIHGADTVMSHITHFYHLAALDYVDVSQLGAPFTPTYSGLPFTAATQNIYGGTVVDNYVQALVIRRKAHTMSAVLSGRHPIQNAIVPGGVTTLPTASDMSVFKSYLNEIRGFINTAYIPDVITVATSLVSFFSVGTGCGNVLSYGEYPIQSGTSTEKLLIKRGVYRLGAGGLITSTTIGPTDLLSGVREYVDYSYYSSPSGLYPGVGETEPDVAKVTAGGRHYTWLKAPRWLSGTNPLPCEVGPLARMVVTYASGATETVSNTGCTNWSVLSGLGSPYSAAQLIGFTLNYFGAGVSALFSVLGRHAARALECKVVADAMYDMSNQLNLTGATYVYAKLPNKPKSGAGWAEAPRGALGHWISIEKKRITNYQCVVPSTWNHSPIDTPGGTHGPAETSVIGANIGSTSDANMLGVLRIIHTFDFCIACAVHVVTTDGKTVAKFQMGTDGSVTKLPHDAEI